MACPSVSAAEALLFVVEQEVEHPDVRDPVRVNPSYSSFATSVLKSSLFEPTRITSLAPKSACQQAQGLSARCDSGMSDRSNPCEVEVFTANRAGVTAHSGAASGRAVLENYSGYPTFHLQLPSDIVHEDGKHSPSGECSAMSNRETQGLHLSSAAAEGQGMFTSSARGEVGSGPLPLFQGNGPLRTSVDAGSSSTQTPPPTISRSPARTTAQTATGKRGAEREATKEGNVRKQARLTGFAARMSGTSAYRGVSWHTQTSRWKAQIKVAGKDVNLGRHRDELEAARAYDRAAICARGEKDAKLNFSIDDYAHEISNLTSMPLSDLAASLRGVEQRLQAQTSRYHGVRLNKRTQKWEAYIRVAGKHVHLGCYDSEVAAAQAFDQAALVRQAHNLGAMGGKPQLVTNFPPMIYLEFTNKLFQLANPLSNNKVVSFHPSTENPGYARLDDKYVQNLLTKCQEQGGSLTAYPALA